VVCFLNDAVICWVCIHVICEWLNVECWWNGTDGEKRYNVDRQAERQTDRETDREIDRQRQRDRQTTERETERQTDARETDTQTDRQTDTCPIASLSITKLPWLDPRANQGLRADSNRQLTYSLTPCSTALPETLTGSQLVKKFPAFSGTRKFITAFTTARHLFPF
jgi:hypothetical protein